MKTAKSVKFPIAAIGASAGGLEALEQFFKSAPEHTGIAFVVIQHLDPNYEGKLPDLLQRTTQMKVNQVTDHMKIVPDHIYVIPRHKNMSILNGYLHLFDQVENKGLRLPIDIFFRSLADDQKANSIGIILSGMGSDGALGLKAIKENGGIVAVQDPVTSKFDGMPRSAMNSVNIDLIASAQEIPARLISFIDKIPSISRNLSIEDKNKNNLEKIDILLRNHTGHDFSQYKKNAQYRRIERRMNVHQIDKISNYLRFLQDNPAELGILFRELLIGVTSFFRDAPLWEFLKDKILPELFSVLPDRYILRVWVTACSTGEEAFSFAMIFREALEKMKLKKNLTLQIFATDIDTDAIELARKGIFNANISADVSPERLLKYFTKNDSTYYINNSIREMVVFAPHDVIKDPPFTRLDFVICRNLLIYMEVGLQKKIMNLFYYSLNAGGTMVLGSAENTGTSDKLFMPIDNKLKIYKRNIAPVEIDRMDFPNSLSQSVNRIKENSPVDKNVNNIQTFADQLLMQTWAPASVLINQDGDILYITGKTGKYLEPAAGKANMNIYAMAREGLRNELLNGIRSSKKSNELSVLRNIKINTGEEEIYIDVTINLIKKPAAFEGMIMIIFSDVPVIKKKIRKKSKSPQNINNADQDLEDELLQTHEELRRNREEMQTTQEELRSANEELQSTNEELQSTNEELITSKEEMQSLNEELQTVNIELQTKVTEYMEANNDMKNLLNSTDIATLFLDKNLNIRRFTDQLTKLFNLRTTDIGRPFTDIASILKYQDLAENSREVLQTLIFKEKDIPARENKWFKVRIMPYRTLDERIDGVVITFIDITLAKNLEAELHDTITILRKHDLYTK